MTATTVLPSVPTTFNYSTKGDIVTLKDYKDPTEEFLIVKENRTNHVVKSLKTGKQGTFPMHLCIYVRKADDTVTSTVAVTAAPKLLDGVWAGAIVTAWVDSRKWTFSRGQKFVVLKVNDRTVNIIELGGTPSPSYRGWNVSFGCIKGVIKPEEL